MLGRLVRRLTSVFRGGSESTGDGDDERKSEDGDGGTVWDLIPSWQYTGLHAESGGLARDEQEKALRDIQQRAEWIEEQTDRADDPRER